MTYISFCADQTAHLCSDSSSPFWGKKWNAVLAFLKSMKLYSTLGHVYSLFIRISTLQMPLAKYMNNTYAYKTCSMSWTLFLVGTCSLTSEWAVTLRYPTVHQQTRPKNLWFWTILAMVAFPGTYSRRLTSLNTGQPSKPALVQLSSVLCCLWPHQSLQKWNII